MGYDLRAHLRYLRGIATDLDMHADEIEQAIGAPRPFPVAQAVVRLRALRGDAPAEWRGAVDALIALAEGPQDATSARCWAALIDCLDPLVSDGY